MVVVVDEGAVVVEQPGLVAVLHDRPDTVNIVVCTNDPNSPSRRKQSASLSEPCLGEIIVCSKIFELIPIILNRVDMRCVWTF